MIKHSTYVRRAVALVGSSWFFRGVIILLVLQAAWIALTGRYPMAFDEDYHLGLIRLYAHHLSPFWDAQPAGADGFGAVARDPSYLYHYLMSLPYRVIATFTSDTMLQVLWLRAINIGLFASGLAIYRGLLVKTSASSAIIHTCLLLFVLIPVIPLLAAQINYDNLALPLTGLILLLVAGMSEELHRRRRLNGSLLALIIGLCLLASLVKYAFLPIFIVIVVYLGIRLWQTYGDFAEIGHSLQHCMQQMGWLRRLLLITLVLIASVLCAERYGVNLIRYHTPVPDCGAVLSVKQCSAYGPWIRDHNLELQKVGDGGSVLDFGGEWLYGMWLRLFFAVDGPGTQFQTRGPFIVPALSAAMVAAVSTLLILWYGRRLFSRYNKQVLSLLIAIIGFYILVLLLDGYEAYQRTGRPVAINGRYLLPVLPPAMLLGLLAVSELLKRRAGLKLALASALVICFLWGGGALTYILRSNDAWYWPNSALRGANHTLQRTAGPAVPGFDSPTEFLR